MSDGSLSQDEIDALLQGTDDVNYDTGSSGLESGAGSGSLSQQEISASLDLMNSASSNIGGALSAMIGKQISLSNPRIESIDLNSLQNQISDEIVEVRIDYESGIVGEHYFILEIQLAQLIGGLMMGQEGNELTDASLSAVSEAVNIISGNSSNTIGTKIKKDLKPSPPVVSRKGKTALSLNKQAEYVKVLYDLSIEGYPPFNLIEIFGLNVVKEMVGAILPATNENVAVPIGAGQNGMQANMMGQQFMGGSQNMMGLQQQPVAQNVQFSDLTCY